jgi:hypothetical protein
MIKFKFAVLCALLVFVGSNVFAQDVPMESHKGKEHRTPKGGGTHSGAAFGDGSVHLDRRAGGTQSSGTGAGKITQTSRNLDAGAFKRTGKKGARLNSRHPGGAN